MEGLPASSQSEAAHQDEEILNKSDETPETYSRLSPSDQSFLQKLKGLLPLGALPVDQERIRMREGQIASAADYPVSIEQRQTSACPVHLIRGLDCSGTEPVLFYLHGGGWVMGDLQTHLKLVCQLALGGRCVVAFIEYPLSPEHRFPAAIEASVTAIGEILASSESLRLDESRFAIAGDSAGGNLAAAVILELMERKLPLPMQQILLYPATDYRLTTPSYRKFRDNPNLSEATMEWFWNQYLPKKSLSTDPRVSPLQAEKARLAQFPPTLLVSCEYDVLRDEGESFVASLQDAGVNVTAARWLGSLHGFLVNESLSGSTSARTCIEMVAQYIRRGFGKD